MDENNKNISKIIPVSITSEMKSSYIDYSMSVIISRALPDVRDGLKPVHRRVLYGMHQLGMFSNRPFKKSARIVGEVLGKFHPHGDSSVYDAMVRMVQSWSLRYELVQGQGNFGSIDGDGPAAMRYTEVKLKKISEDMLIDIEKNTVDTRLNFDDTTNEPVVLPSRIPNFLVNGTSGIAVGMATNMLPHNLKEAIDATIAYIDDNDIEIEQLMKYVKAPDFPTGGIIYGYEGVKDAYNTGRGKVVLRAKYELENINGKECIVVSEIPYQVNKSEMIKKTANLINERRIEGISSIRDESNREGLRIIYTLKSGVIPDIIINKLYKYTQLENSYSINSLALVKGRPKLLNLKDIIYNFVDHRHEVVVRRTKFELDQAEKRAHILEGLLIAIDNIDEIIQLIKSSKNVEEARANLIKTFSLTEIQAQAILEMRLQKLTGLEMDKVKKEYQELLELIEKLKKILSDRVLRMDIIKEELLEIKNKYGDKRRTEIDKEGGEIKLEDLIPNEEMVVTISRSGYIKTTKLSDYKIQNRGGVGQRGSGIKQEDSLEHIYVANTHQFMLFFTQRGKCYWLRVFEIPKGNKNSKGRAIQNLLSIEKGDKINSFIKVDDLKDKQNLEGKYIIMATKRGMIKKTALVKYSNPNKRGIQAIKIRPGDNLLQARLTDGENYIVMATTQGKAIVFDEKATRSQGRNTYGVIGVKIDGNNDEVVGMIRILKNSNDNILVVSENGYGKRSKLETYRQTNRGGKGVKTINITDKTGKLISIQNVSNKDELMIITKAGVTIRINMSRIRVIGRVSQGVKLISLKGGESIASITKIEKLDI